ncbi:transposase [Thalassotalea litorea]|uniref:Transposase n=1 Tax=Thalassotalea litorea TaxID=2020715 RepID=A0A5R9IBY3_9GAMM|nr:transposase [Thalassotalea litorea]TLU61111.1 transposase [Thalassotalea litorea]
MARQPRLNLADIPQHIIQRGNNKINCFFHQRDFAYYLKLLKEYADKFDVSVHAFVLMSNHVHLLLTPSSSCGVSQMMQSIGRCYVRYFNLSYERTGTLWEGRYKSCLVDSENYFLEVSRYIELNPVRANICSSPEQYAWSSYHANGLNKEIALITPHPLYEGLAQTKEQRKKVYRLFVNAPVDNEQTQLIRKSVNKDSVLGSAIFKTKLSSLLGKAVDRSTHGGDRKSAKFRNQRL